MQYIQKSLQEINSAWHTFVTFKLNNSPSSTFLCAHHKLFVSSRTYTTRTLYSLDRSLPQMPLTTQSIINNALVRELTCSLQYTLRHAYIASKPPMKLVCPRSNTAALPIYLKMKTTAREYEGMTGKTRVRTPRSPSEGIGMAKRQLRPRQDQRWTCHSAREPVSVA